MDPTRARTREVQPEQLTKALADEVGIPFLDQIKPADVPAQMIDAVKPLFPEGIRLRWAPVLSALRP